MCPTTEISTVIDAITAVTLTKLPFRLSLSAMKLKALIMCRNPHNLRLVAHTLKRFDFRPDSCHSAEEAIELVARSDYEVVMLDFDVAEAAKAAKFARMTPQHRRPVIFGMIGPSTEVERSLRAGVNFPLYKPLEPEQLVHSIRAAYGFVRRDRRYMGRYAIETVVYLLLGRHLVIPTLMVNLSEDGFSIQAAEPLPPFEKVAVHFRLPGTRRAIDTMAELVWSDSAGKAGMFLSDINFSTQRFLRNWLARHAQQRQLPSSDRASSRAAVLV